MGAQSDIGWNRHTSNKSKVNNFYPLLNTGLLQSFFPFFFANHFANQQWSMIKTAMAA